MLIADLHIHSKYSRATSADCVPEQLEWWARRKGIGLVGTGDFTHPAWRAELMDKLVPAGDGLHRFGAAPGFPDARAAPNRYLCAENGGLWRDDAVRYRGNGPFSAFDGRIWERPCIKRIVIHSEVEGRGISPPGRSEGSPHMPRKGRRNLRPSSFLFGQRPER